MSQFIEPCESRRLMSHTLTTAQRSAMNELANELVSYHTQRIIPQAVVKAVYGDLLQCVERAHAASSSVAKSAIADAQAAAKDGVFTTKERSLIATDVVLVLRSAGISKTLAQQTGTDVSALLHSAKLNSTEVGNVFGTLVAIGNSF